MALSCYCHRASVQRSPNRAAAIVSICKFHPHSRTVSTAAIYSEYKDKDKAKVYDYTVTVKDEDDDEEEISKALYSKADQPRQLLSVTQQRMYLTDFLPDRTVGNVVIQQHEDGNWGLFATSTIKKGEVMLVSVPLAMLRDPAGNMPSESQLITHIMNQDLTPMQYDMYSLLYRGQPRQTVQDAPIPDLLDIDPTPRKNMRQPMRLNWPRRDVAGLVRHNAYSAVFQDLPVAVCRNDDPSPCVGIWPEFSLINHSCSPNATHYLIGDRMIVRATRALIPGDEVTVNYLGREVMGPRDNRRAELKSAFGFDCNCERCMLDQRVNESMSSRIQSVSDMMEELRPVLMTAIRGGDSNTISSILEELENLVDIFKLSFDANGPVPMNAGPTKDEGLLEKASVYELFDLRVRARLALNRASYEALLALADCVPIIARIVPGSDLHTLTVAKMATLVAARFGAEAAIYGDFVGNDEVDLYGMLFGAMQDRYGALDMNAYTQLSKASMQAAEEIDSLMQEAEALRDQFQEQEAAQKQQQELASAQVLESSQQGSYVEARGMTEETTSVAASSEDVHAGPVSYTSQPGTFEGPEDLNATSLHAESDLVHHPQALPPPSPSISLPSHPTAALPQPNTSSTQQFIASSSPPHNPGLEPADDIDSFLLEFGEGSLGTTDQGEVLEDELVLEEGEYEEEGAREAWEDVLEGLEFDEFPSGAVPPNAGRNDNATHW